MQRARRGLARRRDVTREELPRRLAGGGAQRAVEVRLIVHGVGPVADPAAIASVLVIEAESLAAAVALTQGHPGLAHGVEIEVRPVKIVAPPPR